MRHSYFYNLACSAGAGQGRLYEGASTLYVVQPEKIATTNNTMKK